MNKEETEYEIIIQYLKNRHKDTKNCDISVALALIKQLQQRIDKAIEYINIYDDGCYTDATLKYKVAELNITELLEILKGEK